MTYRWYVLGRVVPLADGKIVTIPPGTEYEITARCSTREEMQAERTKLDQAGRVGIWVHSSSRRRAVVDARECWGVSVKRHGKSRRSA